MVVAELALTIVLLCGAGLMLRSFVALAGGDPGFDVDGLARMKMQLPPSNYPTPEARLRFFDQLLPKVEAIPGVQSAAFTTSVPPLNDEEWRFEVDGQRYAKDEPRPWTGTVTITPGYFDVLGVSIKRGRAFDNSDGAAGAETVVIGQLFADRYFPGEDPVGRRIRFMPRDDEREPQPWRTIIGVVARLQARRRWRGLPQSGRLPAVPPGGAADRVAAGAQCPAGGERDDGRAIDCAADRSRSAGLQHRDHRRGVRERAIDLPHLRHVVRRAGGDRAAAVGDRRLRRHRLLGHATDAGNRRPHGDRRRAAGMCRGCSCAGG